MPPSPAGRARFRTALKASCFALGVVSLVAAPAGAQLTPSDSARVPIDSRSPITAGLLQWVSGPLLLGYVYAGDVKRGLVPGAVMAGGFTLFLLNVDAFFTHPAAAEGDVGVAWAGLLAALGANVYSIVDAANAARDRNARLSTRGAPLRFVPTPLGVDIGLTVSVP